ncbi:unnamed protein product [Brachionus calyciflorus]|uniref:Disease resistance R13L4/SHOC-2-like LRR domain-containing protein n=1 Tax=Brachionus calyciflorus TaxID=104777 RepID=A0A813TLS5_9BILA|nr:unnamed protein product [Brachionus calyciflorus]
MTELTKHSHQKNSKYHYHLKSDKIYGDKKLKLCGKCIIPSNLSNDLKQLNKLTRNLNPEDEEESHPIDFNKDLIDFEVLDLTAERQSGLNLPLVFLPNDLFSFKQLKRLHLDCNMIRVIPDMLGDNLVSLEILTITSNLLQSLPNSLANLKKLHSIHLASNEFKQFPDVLCKIKTLRFLDLSSNKLESLPSMIGDLKNLESLLLFQNNLKSVPKTIGKLEFLRTLWLGNNNLNSLPYKITNLINLDWDDLNLTTNIDGNPLVDPPLEVCIKGLNSIREYYQNNNDMRN